MYYFVAQNNIKDTIPNTVTEFQRKKKDERMIYVTAGGDPPISGGFPSPTALKEEPFTPVSDNNASNNPSSDLQTQLDTFGAEDLNDLDRELVGDGFTLSRLLGGDNPSPTTVR